MTLSNFSFNIRFFYSPSNCDKNNRTEKNVVLEITAYMNSQVPDNPWANKLHYYIR